MGSQYKGFSLLCRWQCAVTPKLANPGAVGFILGFFLSLLLPCPALAGEPCGSPCGGDPVCAVDRGTCLLREGAWEQALQAIKPAFHANPQQGAIARLLAQAYHRSGNDLWALRTLWEHLEASPDDYESRTWAAWYLIGMGDLEQAALLLDISEPGADPLNQRRELLVALIAALSGDRGPGVEIIRSIYRSSLPLFPEDKALFSYLESVLNGSTAESIYLRLLLSTGYSTNAIEGTPEEATASSAQQTSSPISLLDTVLLWEPRVMTALRPLAEARLKATLPTAHDAWPHAMFSSGARIGLALGRQSALETRLLYSAELLVLNDGDDYSDSSSRLFMEAHRLEAELYPAPWMQVFGGAGRRVYREWARTRTEADMGLALLASPADEWNLTVVVSGRAYAARNEAYSGYGFTGITRLGTPLPMGGMFKAVGMLIWDRYPDSANYYGVENARTDSLGKLQAGPWTPAFKGLRAGLTYTWRGRRSTVGEYEFTEHRLLAELRWHAETRTRGLNTIQVSTEHQYLAFDVGQQKDSGLDRVQDLLRQEESARRGSTCAD